MVIIPIGESWGTSLSGMLLRRPEILNGLERGWSEISILLVEPARIAGTTAHTTVITAGYLGIAAQEGCFETFFCLPVRNLVEVSPSISDEEAVFSEPLAAALEIQEQIHIRPEMEVMIIGAGRMGLLIAQTLALTGCHILVAIRKPKPRVESLLRKWNLPAIDIAEIVTHPSDLVIEITGSPEGFALARQAVHPGGTIVVKSTYKGNIEINLSALVTAEITLIGSRCGSQAAAIRLLESHKIDLLSLIEAVYPLNKGLTAFEHAAKPGILKVLFSPR